MNEEKETLVEKAISAGTTDPATISKLIELQTYSEEVKTRKSFYSAFAIFQGKMPAIEKAKSSRTAKYADYADIMKKARPILAANGLSLSFDQSETDGMINMKVILNHVDGHCQITNFTLPKDAPIQSKAGNSVTNLAQAQGSANSYAKRYAVCNALDIVLIGEDDDAEALSGESITAEQAAEINASLESSGSDVEKFLQWAGCGSVEEMPASKLAQASRMLAKKGESK